MAWLSKERNKKTNYGKYRNKLMNKYLKYTE